MQLEYEASLPDDVKAKVTAALEREAVSNGCDLMNTGAVYLIGYVSQRHPNLNLYSSTREACHVFIELHKHNMHVSTGRCWQGKGSRMSACPVQYYVLPGMQAGKGGVQ